MLSTTERAILPAPEAEQYNNIARSGNGKSYLPATTGLCWPHRSTLPQWLAPINFLPRLGYQI